MLFEFVVRSGKEVGRTITVASGQTVGLVHFIERPDREPVPVVAPSAGVLIGSRGPSVVTQGDCVACIAHDVDLHQLRR